MKKLGLILFSIVLLFPVYWMFVYSFSTVRGIMSIPPMPFPLNPTVENYTYLITNMPIGQWLLNTGIVLSLVLLLSIMTSAFAGYAFAMFNFPGKRILFWVFMVTIIMPGQSLFIAKFVTIRQIGLYGSFWSVILPYLFNPIHIFLFRNYLNEIPGSFRDSAKMDGAGEVRILVEIYAPLCKPIIAGLCLFLSIGVLSDYMWQYLMLPAYEDKTLIVGVIETVMRDVRIELRDNPLGLRMAGGVITFMPILLVFIFLGRYFERGLAVGGVRE